MLSKTASHSEHRNENIMDMQKNAINVESMIRRYSPIFHHNLNDHTEIVVLGLSL